MASPKKKLTDELAKQVAYLLFRGETQKVTARRLGVSEALVWKAKRRAEEMDWLCTKPRLRLPLKELERLEQQAYTDGLKSRLQDQQPRGEASLHTLRVFGLDHPARRGDAAAQSAHLQELGERVALHLVEEVFPHVDTVGLSWGGTLLATIRGMDPDAVATMSRRDPITFFPVCGAPPDATTVALRSASNLVALLDEMLNEDTYNPNNFSGIVAAIPHRYTEEAAGVLWRYFYEDNLGFANVFGRDGEEGLVHGMDAVLTGIGSADPDEDPWVIGAAEAAGIDPEVLAEGTFGNIAGTFLPRPGIEPAMAAAVVDANERWTGIRPEHFRACARRAARGERGGSVVIASGWSKAEILLECIRRGLVSQVVVDDELAVALAKKVQPKKDQP